MYEIHHLTMNLQKIKHHHLRLRTASCILALVLSLFSLNVSIPTASAAQITNRKITLSNSAGAATGVTYALTTDAMPTATAIRSVGVQMCTTASGACTLPTGFTSTSSILSAQPTGLGAASGWTVNAATAGELRIVNAANATVPSGAVAITWGTVTNPTATNTTFFARTTTYSDAAWTTPLDTGAMALSTAQQISVALAVNETLTFCTGTSITGQNCGTVAGSSVNLGTGSTSATASGTSVMAASTNATSGYSITVNGATLTSGANTLTALAAQTASTTGSSQFGLNLRANTTPSVGLAISGAGTGAATANYNTVDQYRFVTGDSVASVVGPTNANTFTVSYIANIAGLTAPGNYTATMTYIATANF